MESFSLHISIISRNYRFLTYLEKSYGALKITKRAYSRLIEIFEKVQNRFISYFEPTERKIFHCKAIFFLVYVAKPTSFEVIRLLNLSTFAAKLVSS